MLDNQALKGWKGNFFPLFLSQDPPTALWSAFEKRMAKKRYMQGECAVIELTCVGESERQFGFVHTIPIIMICIDVVQANDVINATAGASKWWRSRRDILQVAVIIPLMQHHRNNKETSKWPKSAKICLISGHCKNTYISKLACMTSGDFFASFQFVLHSYWIMADNQPLAGLRGCCPAQSVKTPRLPCGEQF